MGELRKKFRGWKTSSVLTAALALQFFGLVACQTFPPPATKAKETPELKHNAVAGDLPLAIHEETILVDARSSFDFEMAHLPGAINLHWEDFTKNSPKKRGVLDEDLFSLTRRLARLGITPETPVVVVGYGREGHGEEGRMAWTLKYLGVKKVDFVAQSFFIVAMTRNATPPRENAPLWKPQVNAGLLVEREPFLKDLTVKSLHPDGPAILDVRPEKDFLRREGDFKNAPDIGAINVPWTQFITTTGRPQTGIREQLSSVGITPNRPIYVISNFGVESALVTLALRDLGYTQVANYAGGYQDLLATKH
jgi:thiosulfate/3-mercaptopyruvate sulfurtransferase